TLGTLRREADQTARNWARAAHLGPIVVSLASVGLLGWIVPLCVMRAQREVRPCAAEHARASLNFRLTMFIATCALCVAPTVFGWFHLDITDITTPSAS